MFLQLQRLLCGWNLTVKSTLFNFRNKQFSSSYYFTFILLFAYLDGYLLIRLLGMREWNLNSY